MTKLSTTKILAALAALALVFSCTKTKVVELDVTPLAVSYQVAGGEQSVNISCNDAWTAVKDADWITLSAEKGEGNATLKITATENKTVERRDAQVIISAGEFKKTVKVQQLGLNPELIVTPEKLEVGCEGGEFDVTITSNIEWHIAIEEQDNWITAVVPNGTGSAVVKLKIDANETVTVRGAKIGVKGGNFARVIDVEQAGEEPGLTVSPESVQATYEGKEQELKVVSNMPWSVVIPEDATWISSDVVGEEGDAIVTLTIEANIYRKTRSAVVSFVASDDLKVDIAVAQDMAPISRQTDSLALVALYNAWGGADKMNSDRKWDITKAMDDAESKWYGVTLTEGRVTSLKFLKGTVTADWTIPDELGDLDQLTELRFVDCKVNGAIPEVLYGLTKLKTLYLTNNKVTGTLSAKIGNLTELVDLYIDQNPDLGGTLPDEIGSLSKLVNLNIAKTSFTGTIPSTVVNLDALKNFMAYTTKFTEVPDFWNELASLELVQLYDIPTFTGALPASLGGCSKLKNIYMYDCNFEGNIPAEWANLPANMLNVRVQGNKLKGVVPAAVQAHPKWSSWKPAQYIFPQQEGYGLTDKAGSGGQDLDGETEADPWN